MKLLLTGAVLLTTIGVHAQMNRISIGLNGLTMRNLTESLPDQQQTNSQKELAFLPSVGYFRMLNKSFGIGLELGYGRSKLTNSTTQEFGNTLVEQGTEAKYEEFYICPTLLESFSSNNQKYRFIASLTLPGSYSPSTTSINYSRSTTNGVTRHTTATAPSGTMMRVGLFLNGGIQRKIAGGLFAGLQAGIGGTYMRTKSEGDLITVSDDGSRTVRREMAVKNTIDEAGLEIRPMFSLNYYF